MSILTETVSSLAVFGGELLFERGAIGAVVPSSRILARRMAAQLPARPAGYVLELGAGTGAVTEALVARGFAADQLIPIELSGKMVRHLRRRFPALRILRGDASNLGALLAEQLPHVRDRVSHIVSSLPLRSLPLPVVARVVREVKRLLPPDGAFVQYTYDLGRRHYRPLAGFELAATSVVWMNLPPARVNLFRPRVAA